MQKGPCVSSAWRLEIPELLDNTLAHRDQAKVRYLEVLLAIRMPVIHLHAMELHRQEWQPTCLGIRIIDAPQVTTLICACSTRA
eukprot:scaffold209773_cov18-Tisochrysis_lutea.AAC.1